MSLPDPEFLNSYHCPDCGCVWSMHARVIRDDDCPRCGGVSRPVFTKQTRDFEGVDLPDKKPLNKADGVR